MPWQCSFKKLCFFAPIMPKIMPAQSAKAYPCLLIHLRLRYRPHVSGLFLKRSFFFLRIRLPSTRKRCFGNRNRMSLKTVSRLYIFLIGYFWSHVDRGKRRFSKTMMSNVVDRQKRLENATCGRGLFRKRKKPSIFKKYPDTCGQAKTI